MTITEPARHRLYEKLEGLLGMDDAATLMEHLPPAGWGDVARRADLDQLHDRMRTEMADLRTDLRTEMADLRTDLRTELALFRDQLQRDRIAAQRQLLFVVVAALLALAATLVTTA